jgi:hypothetical protein
MKNGKSTMENGKWAAVLLVLLLGGSTVSTMAQQPPPPAARFFIVEEEVIDPALIDQYEQALKTIIAEMKKAKFGPEANWNASEHGQSRNYIFGAQSLADIEPQSSRLQQIRQQFKEKIDADVYRRFIAAVAPAVLSVRLFALEKADGYDYQPANSIVKDAKYSFVQIHRVRVDQREQYKSVMTRTIDALKKVRYPIGWNAFHIVAGEGRAFFDDGRTYYYVARFDSHSQLYDQNSLAAALESALGKEGAKQLHSDLMKTLEGIETYDNKLRPDLGYRAGSN